MRSSLWRFARAKRGQTAWNPLSIGTQSSSSPNIITCAEMQAIATKPLPKQHTVEYEEDLGYTVILQREYISPKAEKNLSADWSAVARSNVELAATKRRLAEQQAREQKMTSVSAGAAAENIVHKIVSNEVDAAVGLGHATQYTFNTHRINFCQRFDAVFPDGRFNNFMEAAAILHGCSDAAAKETYLWMFLRLDRESLNTEAEAVMNIAADLEELNRRRRRLGRSVSTKQRRNQQRELSTPDTPTFAGGDVFAAARGSAVSPPSVGDMATVSTPTAAVDNDDEDEDVPHDEGEDGATEEAAQPIPDELADFAPMMKVVKAYCAGEAPSYATPTLAADGETNLRGGGSVFTGIGATARYQERLRWRRLLELAASEDYHRFTAADIADVEVLNQQLGTVKIFEGKLGEIAKETLKLHRRDPTAGSIHSPSTVAERSPVNPEKRDA